MKTFVLSTLFFLTVVSVSFAQNTFPASGNVGIGTGSPNKKLTISGSASDADAQVNILNPTVGTGHTSGFLLETAQGWGVLLRTVEGTAWLELADRFGGWKHRWNNEDYYAKGKIKAQEIKVETPVSYPDYVFEPGYKLPALEEVEKYIITHKHLAGIASEEEARANDGIDIGALNVKLLEKVEELTLYLVEQNKKLKQQEKLIIREKQNTLNLQNDLNNLKKEINALKK